MTSLRCFRFLLLGVTGGLLAACVQPEAPQDRFYRVSADVPQSGSANPALRGVLRVERPDADGLLAGRSIVYTFAEPDAPLQEYGYDYWDRPPSLMLRDELFRCLEGGGVADLVVTEQTRVDAEYSLIGQLIRFERIESQPPRAVVEIRLGLRDNVEDELLIWTIYAAAKDAADDTMPASAAAFGAAVSEICAQLTADLKNRS